MRERKEESPFGLASFRDDVQGTSVGPGGVYLAWFKASSLLMPRLPVKKKRVTSQMPIPVVAREEVALMMHGPEFQALICIYSSA